MSNQRIHSAGVFSLSKLDENAYQPVNCKIRIIKFRDELLYSFIHKNLQHQLYVSQINNFTLKVNLRNNKCMSISGYEKIHKYLIDSKTSLNDILIVERFFMESTL